MVDSKQDHRSCLWAMRHPIGRSLPLSSPCGKNDCQLLHADPYAGIHRFILTCVCPIFTGGLSQTFACNANQEVLVSCAAMVNAGDAGLIQVTFYNSVGAVIGTNNAAGNE